MTTLDSTLTLDGAAPAQGDGRAASPRADGAAPRRVGIAGAGLLGRLCAWHLAGQGFAVDVFDPAPDAGPCFADRANPLMGITPHWLSHERESPHTWPQAAGFTAAGMLSPIAELDNAEPGLAALGWRSIVLWRAIVQALGRARGGFAPFYAQRGSWMLAHRPDLGSAQRVLARLAAAGRNPAWQDAVSIAYRRFMNDESAIPALGLTEAGAHGMPQALGLAQLQAQEPSLAGAAHAWFLPAEGQLDTANTLIALYLAAQAGQGAGHVQWHWGERVEHVGEDGCLHLHGPAGTRTAAFDLAIDTRGLGARPDLPMRGVRGDLVWLHAPGHGLTRPVRLLHPRHRVYIVPRPGDLLLVGASEIESEDRSPVSLRSAVELMAAAHSVLPAAAEARVVRMDVNLRPALPDNGPRIEAGGQRLRINGLFRHGWLLAPALLQQAMHAAGLPSALAGVSLSDMGGTGHAPWLHTSQEAHA
jgi:glycine oxidase